MKKKTKATLELIVFVIVILILYLLVSYFVDKNLGILKELFIESPVLGVFGYIFLSTISVIIFPFITVPLVPLATGLFGWPVAALLSTFSWTIGSITAFFIGRKYGKSFVNKFVSVEKLEQAEKLVPENYIFFSLIILRISLPADVLSYALGVLTKVNYKTFTSTTVLGLIPPAFFLSYVGSLPLVYEIIAIVLGSVIVGIIFLLMWRKNVRY